MASNGMASGTTSGRRIRDRSRLAAVMVALVAWPLLALAAPALAQPRCVFLECGPSESPNPNPVQAPAVATIRPLAVPQQEMLQRARLAGEICADVGGFRYCVTSVLKPQFGFTYGPEKMLDTDLKTAWVEGKGGHGEGESLVVELGGRRTVTAIQVMNGYHKNERLFLANSRVQVAELQFSNGETRRVSLADAPGVQTIDVGRQAAEWVRFTIRTVFPGIKYKDTAVTEFRVVTE